MTQNERVHARNTARTDKRRSEVPIRLLYFALGAVTALAGIGIVARIGQSAREGESTICVGSTAPLTLVAPPDDLAPFADWHELPPALASHVDGQGVPVWSDGTFHPGNAATLGIRVLNEGQVDRARMLANKLIAEGESRSDGLWFPYRFSYTYDRQLIAAPWYSGLAQGVALAFLSRLYERTADPAYAAAAREVRRTLEPDGPVTPDGRIEESPVNDSILNGWIFGLLGLYEYGRVFADQQTTTLFLSGLTTLRSQLHRYIGVDGSLWYDLDRLPLDGNYLRLHVELFAWLNAITSEPCFDEASRLYAARLGA